jgi:hypothetical protein
MITARSRGVGQRAARHRDAPAFCGSVLSEEPLILDLELWRRRDVPRLVRVRHDLAEATVSMIALSWPPALGPL